MKAVEYTKAFRHLSNELHTQNILPFSAETIYQGFQDKLLEKYGLFPWDMDLQEGLSRDEMTEFSTSIIDDFMSELTVIKREPMDEFQDSNSVTPTRVARKQGRSDGAPKRPRGRPRIHEERTTGSKDRRRKEGTRASRKAERDIIAADEMSMEYETVSAFQLDVVQNEVIDSASTGINDFDSLCGSFDSRPLTIPSLAVVQPSAESAITQTLVSGDMSIVPSDRPRPISPPIADEIVQDTPQIGSMNNSLASITNNVPASADTVTQFQQTALFSSVVQQPSIIICPTVASIPPGRQRAKILQCGICFSVDLFDRHHEMRRHMESRHMMGQFPCNVPGCNRIAKPFTRADKLLEHKRKVHRIGVLSNN